MLTSLQLFLSPHRLPFVYSLKWSDKLFAVNVNSVIECIRTRRQSYKCTIGIRGACV